MADQYRTEIQQMMFVGGESGDISVETTTVVERIVRQQVTELVITDPKHTFPSGLFDAQLSRANLLANRRGSRVVSCDDLIFLIRDDKEKISRLRTFLLWKELRKNAKEKDDKAGLDLVEIGEGNSADVDALPLDRDPSREAKGAKISLPWDVSSFFNENIPELNDTEEQDQEANDAQLRRLKFADERTKTMTREEYAFWSECRQATFTRRKRNKFREWAGIGVVTDSKIGEDIMDILGFLTFQMVQTLTEAALRVKRAEEAVYASSKRDQPETVHAASLFAAREEPTAPVGPQHVQEAFRRLQRSDVKRRSSRHQGRGSNIPLRLF